MRYTKPFLVTMLFALLFTYFTIAQQKISIDSVAYHIGQNVTVCSKVFGTHTTKVVKPVTYLNLGAAFPDQKLTLVIFQKDRPNFQSSMEEYYNLQGVCATGKLKEYKGRAEMILSSPSEIKIF